MGDEGFGGDASRGALVGCQHASGPECPFHEHSQECFQARLSLAAFHDADGSGNGFQSAEILVALLSSQAVFGKWPRRQPHVRDARQAWVATDELFGLPPTRVRHDQVQRPRQTCDEFGGQFDGDWTGVEQQRCLSRLRQTGKRHSFVTSAANTDFAVRQSLGRQSGRVGGQHFFGGVHENDHASSQNKLRNHRAEAEWPANFATRAAVRGQDRSHCLAFVEGTDPLTGGAD